MFIIENYICYTQVKYYNTESHHLLFYKKLLTCLDLNMLLLSYDIEV